MHLSSDVATQIHHLENHLVETMWSTWGEKDRRKRLYSQRVSVSVSSSVAISCMGFLSRSFNDPSISFSCTIDHRVCEPWHHRPVFLIEFQHLHSERPFQAMISYNLFPIPPRSHWTLYITYTPHWCMLTLPTMGSNDHAVSSVLARCSPDASDRQEHVETRCPENFEGSCHWHGSGLRVKICPSMCHWLESTKLWHMLYQYIQLHYVALHYISCMDDACMNVAHMCIHGRPIINRSWRWHLSVNHSMHVIRFDPSILICSGFSVYSESPIL